MGLWRVLRDCGVAVGLALALLVVFWLDGCRKGNEPAPLELRPVETAQTPAQPASFRLAVTPPEFDDVGRLLDTLGAGYRHTDIEMDDLLAAKRLSPFDVVFLTCGGVPRWWLGRFVREGERDSGGVYRARPAVVRQLEASLRDYVGRGGTLYASDWQFELVAMAFPEYIDKSKIDRGDVQVVDAEVVDASLRKRIGPRIALRFDQPSWRPAAFDESKATTYLRGAYKTLSGGQTVAPLLVRFPFRDGHVIFTSFHNEKQNSDTELELLRCLVFATVTAQLDAKVEQTMIRGGFSPVDRNLLERLAARTVGRSDLRLPEGGPAAIRAGFREPRRRVASDGRWARRPAIGAQRRFHLHARRSQRGRGQVDLHDHAGEGALREFPVYLDRGREAAIVRPRKGRTSLRLPTPSIPPRMGD